MLQSVGLEYGVNRREVTTDVSIGSEIELLISPFAFNSNATTSNNASESTVNEVLNHQWTFYIEVGIINFPKYIKLAKSIIRNSIIANLLIEVIIDHIDKL